MLIKIKKINGTVESEINVGDRVTINYYSAREYATIVAIDHECKWVKVKSNATGSNTTGSNTTGSNTTGAIYTYYKTRKKDFTLFTDTGKYSLDNYGSYLTFTGLI